MRLVVDQFAHGIDVLIYDPQLVNSGGDSPVFVADLQKHGMRMMFLDYTVTPVISVTHISKLPLSTGHGPLRWSMAAGTGHVMADLIAVSAR